MDANNCKANLQSKSLSINKEFAISIKLTHQPQVSKQVSYKWVANKQPGYINRGI
jgi:hypothetical protein